MIMNKTDYLVQLCYKTGELKRMGLPYMTSDLRLLTLEKLKDIYEKVNVKKKPIYINYIGDTLEDRRKAIESLKVSLVTSDKSTTTKAPTSKFNSLPVVVDVTSNDNIKTFVQSLNRPPTNQELKNELIKDVTQRFKDGSIPMGYLQEFIADFLNDDWKKWKEVSYIIGKINQDELPRTHGRKIVNNNISRDKYEMRRPPPIRLTKGDSDVRKENAVRPHLGKYEFGLNLDKHKDKNKRLNAILNDTETDLNTKTELYLFNKYIDEPNKITVQKHIEFMIIELLKKISQENK